MNRRIPVAIALCALSLTTACGSGTQLKAVGPGSSVNHGRYTTEGELAAIDRILAAQKTKPFLYKIDASGPSSDGTGVIIYASWDATQSATFAKQLQDAAGGIPVTVEVHPSPETPTGTAHPSN